MRRFASVLTLLAAVLVAGPAQAALKITPLSSRAETVTAGDGARARRCPAPHARARDARVHLNGRDVTSAFRAGDGGLTGLVTGLREGRNRLEATAERRERARLDLRNDPMQGPVFSGPHEQPFVCETESFCLPVIGGNLGGPLDEDYSVATRVDRFYRTTAGPLRRLARDAGRNQMRRRDAGVGLCAAKRVEPRASPEEQHLALRATAIAFAWLRSSRADAYETPARDDA
jgi:Tannase-like family of unknown function (DUF6351)